MPTFGATAPLSYYAIPERERATRCELETDTCVIDNEHFFVRGCIEIAVADEPESFAWGVWVSLSEKNFRLFQKTFELNARSQVGPFFGWLDAYLKPYPETMNLKTMVHLRNDGIRPFIELEPTDHPLSLEQIGGISVKRVAEIYSLMMHE